MDNCISNIMDKWKAARIVCGSTYFNHRANSRALFYSNNHRFVIDDVIHIVERIR